jgi:integrase/recombinase XerD
MLENCIKSPSISDNKTKESSDQTLPLFLEFQEWMRTQRGTLDNTLNGYRLPIISLLKNLGTDPSRFTAKTLREFLIREMASFSQEKSKNWATAIRMFLRFLIAKGRCQSGLEYAIPTIAR